MVTFAKWDILLVALQLLEQLLSKFLDKFKEKLSCAKCSNKSLLIFFPFFVTGVFPESTILGEK